MKLTELFKNKKNKKIEVIRMSDIRHIPKYEDRVKALLSIYVKK